MVLIPGLGAWNGDDPRVASTDVCESLVSRTKSSLAKETEKSRAI